MKDGLREIELKLAGDLDALSAVEGAPQLASAKMRATRKLRSVYFDAEDRRLRDAGMTLRVRHDGRRRIQTVKTAGDGLLERGEWERTIAGSRPDAGAVAETPAGPLLADDSAVKPVFNVNVDRKTFLVERGGSSIEVAIDHGRIATDEGRGPDTISEVELELKSGSPAALFELARELGSVASLRVSVMTKSERGYALLEKERQDFVKAAPACLHPTMSAAEAFRAVVHSCLGHMLRNEAVLLDRPSVEALHQLRVAIRRLRSAASLFKKVVSDAESRSILSELKRLSGPFGEARNLDVFLAETLPAERERRPNEPGILNLEAQLEAKRADAHASVRKQLRSPEWRRLVLDLVAWADAGRWLSPEGSKDARRLGKSARKVAAKELSRRFSKVARQGARLEKISVERRHKVRIEAKKLRYGAEFFAGLFPGEKQTDQRRAFVKALKRMQGRLGDLNDAANGKELLGDAADELDGRLSLFAAGMASADLERSTEEKIAAASAAYQDFMSAQPFWR